MISIDKSWVFLRDFYHSDRSIVSLINKAVGYRIDKSLRGDSFETLMEDLLSLLPTRGKSYQDFLSYVKPVEDIEEEEDENELGNDDDENEKAIDISIHENAFLSFNWFENFIDETFGIIPSIKVATSLATRSLARIIRQRLKTREKQSSPTFNRKRKYIVAAYRKIIYFPSTVSSMPNLYKPYLILQALGLAEDWFLYDSKSKDFIADDNVRKFFRFLRQQRLKKIQEKRRNSIKKKRSSKTRIELSPVDLYPIMTLLIVLRREWEYSNNGNYIHYKYNSFDTTKDKLSDALIYGLYRKFEQKVPEIIKEYNSDVPRIEFHPLVAKHLIENGSYKLLFVKKYNENSGEMVAPKDELYEAAEKKLDKETFTDKRLLLDYIFPYTEVRDHDVFKPNENEWSLTDRIYISLVKGKEYMHYWREPGNDERFDYIQIEPVRNTSGDIEDNRVVFYQEYLSATGNFLVVKSKEDYELEDKVEKAFSDFRHDLKPLRFNLSNEINQLQRKWDSTDVVKQKERIDRIKDYYSMLNAFIEMANNPKPTEQNVNLEIVDFLRRYSQFIAMARNSGTIQYNVNDSAVPEDYSIYFNRALLTVILDAIIDNAIKHGFSDYHDCVTPTIEFELVDTEHYLILKVCNNGRPIDITSADFKTRGIFAGPTGHTGLGGYLINKHMVNQGGKIELPSPDERTWNTEIHLYLKKDGSKK